MPIISGFINKDKTTIAVKVIDLSGITTKVKKHLLACEIEALKKMNHQSVIKIY